MINHEMTLEHHPADQEMQRAIAARISPLYCHIDLTIPAQQIIADKVRSDLLSPPLCEGSAVHNGLNEVMMNIERGEI